MHQAAVSIRRGTVRLQLNGFGEIRQGLLKPPLRSRGDPAAVIRLGVGGVSLNGFRVVLNRLLELADVLIPDPEDVVGLRILILRNHERCGHQKERHAQRGNKNRCLTLALSKSRQAAGDAQRGAPTPERTPTAPPPPPFRPARGQKGEQKGGGGGSPGGGCASGRPCCPRAFRQSI